MRDIRPGRNLRPDGRLVSIRRVSAKPIAASFEREDQGSTIDGPVAPFIACTVTGRVDVYSVRKSPLAETSEDQGRAAAELHRFEVPYPTDMNDVTVDIERGDYATIAGVVYRAIQLSYGDGYLEVLLERYL